MKIKSYIINEAKIGGLCFFTYKILKKIINYFHFPIDKQAFLLYNISIRKEEIMMINLIIGIISLVASIVSLAASIFNLLAKKRK